MPTGALPPGVRLTRTTPEFTADSVPAGLLAAHRVADDVWGLLRVLAGTVVFVLEEDGDGAAGELETGEAVTVEAGETQLIEPGVLHHVELGDGARFVVEFYR